MYQYQVEVLMEARAVEEEEQAAMKKLQLVLPLVKH
jgi:hypothetical protein